MGLEKKFKNYGRATHLGRKNSDLLKGRRSMRYASLDYLVKDRGTVVPSIVPEKIFVDIFLDIFPVAPRMDAPWPVLEVADLDM